VKQRNASQHLEAFRIIPTAATTAIALAAALTFGASAHAARIVVPAIPPNLQLPDGNHPFLVGHALGTQNYICVPSSTSATGVTYTLFTPEATLFDEDFKQLITHFFSPNPFEANANPAVVADGAIRATWQAADNSSVWAQVKKDRFGNPEQSTDPAFVKEGAVAWLKLTAVGKEPGLTGGDRLAHTTFVHRLSTEGGVAPGTGCSSTADLGNQAFVPYKADYFFYTDQ